MTLSYGNAYHETTLGNEPTLPVPQFYSGLVFYTHRQSRSLFITRKMESDGSESRDLHLSKLNWQDYNMTLESHVFSSDSSLLNYKMTEILFHSIRVVLGYFLMNIYYISLNASNSVISTFYMWLKIFLCGKGLHERIHHFLKDFCAFPLGLFHIE